VKTIRPIDGILAVLAVFFFSIAMIDYWDERFTFSAIAIGLCAVSAILLAAIYLLSEEYRIILVIVLASATLSAYAAEIYVARRNLAQQMMGPVALALAAEKPSASHPWRGPLMGHGQGPTNSGQRADGKPVDTRLKIQVIDDLVARGVPRVAPLGTYPMFQSSKGQIPPLSGLSNSNSVACNESGEWVVLKLDRHGFNNSVDAVWRPPLDIAFVGSSIGFGLCMHSGEGLVDHLRAEWPRTSNISFIGSGPVSFLRRMYEYLPDLKPKLVLFEYNDLLLLVLNSESPRQFGFNENPTTFAHSKIGMINMQEEIDSALMKEIDAAQAEERLRIKSLQSNLTPWFPETVKDILLSRSLRNSPIVRNLLNLPQTISQAPPKPAEIGIARPPDKFGRRRLSGAELARQPQASPENLQKLGLVLTRANEFMKGWGGKLAFVYLPLYTMEDQIEGVEASFTLHDEIVDIAKAAGLDVIDLQFAFINHPDPFSFFPDPPGHYNAKGHKYIADRLIEAITKRGLLPRNTSTEHIEP
jgi:hypothetical protein